MMEYAFHGSDGVPMLQMIMNGSPHKYDPGLKRFVVRPSDEPPLQSLADPPVVPVGFPRRNSFP
jgi:hypothetical protein